MELKENAENSSLEWKIEDFTALSDRNGECSKCAQFVCCGVFWKMKIYANGDSKDNIGYISVHLLKLSPKDLAHDIDVTFRMRYKDTIVKTRKSSATYSGICSRAFKKFAERSLVLEKMKNSSDKALTINGDITVNATRKLEINNSLKSMTTNLKKKLKKCFVYYIILSCILNVYFQDKISWKEKENFINSKVGSYREEETSYIVEGTDMAPEAEDKYSRKSELEDESIDGEKESNNLADIKCGKGMATPDKDEQFRKLGNEEGSKKGEKTSSNLADPVTETVEINSRNSDEKFHDAEETSNKVEDMYIIWKLALFVFFIFISNFQHFAFNSERNARNLEDESKNVTDTWQTRMSRIYDTKEYADVQFVVQGKVFEAHRFVLAMRSKEFRRLVTGANASYNTHIVDKENVTEAAFDILLRFLYKDTLETTDKKSIIEVYHCALAYQVQDMQDRCDKEMSTWDISACDVCALLDIALDVPTLRNKCMALLREQGAAAISSHAFLEVSSKTLQFMLTSGVLENVPVLDQIKRILEWCVHPNTVETEYSEVRNKLLRDEILGRLQLQNLELNELTHVVDKYRGLITPEEIVCFLNYNHTRDASVLPDWCLPASTE